MLVLRAGGALAILLIEYLFLAVRLDGTNVSRNIGVWGNFANVGATVSIGFAVFSAGLIRRRELVLTAFAELKARAHVWELRWCAAHLLIFGVFAWWSERVFAPAGLSSGHAGAWLAAWVVLVALSVVSLLRATFGAAWWVLGGALARIAWAGLLLGIAAFYAGFWTQALWPWLARRTLAFAVFALSLVTKNVHADPSACIIALDGVEVEIAQGCSGIEGTGLVLVLVGGYLFTFRRRLRLARAIWVLPASVAIVWLLNGLRVAVLIAVAAWISPDIAFGGFHSKAGWIAVCLVALGTVWLVERSPFFVRDPLRVVETENPTAAYLSPLVVMLGVGLVTGVMTHEIDWLYGLRLLAGLAALFAYRSYYRKLFGRPSVFALVAGAVVFAFWILLVPAGGAEPAALSSAPRALRIAWVSVRVVGSVSVVPVAEELAFRGFLQRRLLGRDFELVPLGRFSWLSLLVSALAFGALHESFWAGTLAGVVYSAVGYRRGELSDCVAAHATTNALLALTALAFGRWDLLA